MKNYDDFIYCRGKVNKMNNTKDRLTTILQHDVPAKY